MKRTKITKMKTTKIICVLLSLLAVMSMTAISSFAMDQNVYKDKFWGYLDSHHITASSADAATNMVNAARATIGMTGKQLSAKGNWCASHISCLALVTGQSKAIPYSTAVKGMYTAVMNAGGTLIYSRYGKGSMTNAKPGDLVIYKSSTDFSHIELVSKKATASKVTSIGGNTGNKDYNKARVQEHTWNKSQVAYIIRPAYKSNVLTYVDRCTKTDTYITVKVTNSSSDYLMSLPCSSKTDSSSKAIRKISKGETFTATAIYKNSAGNLWYKVTAVKDGKIGYIYGGCANYLETPKNIVSGNAQLASSTLKKGKAQTISGKITSNVNIESVTGVLQQGSGNSQTAKVSSVNAKSFTVKGSKIDSSLKFGKLGASGYLQLSVVVSTPYISNNKIIYKSTTVVLPKVNFTVK